MGFWLQRNLSVGETLITSPPLTSFKVRFAIANFYCNLLTCILTRVNLSQQSESSKLTRVSQSSISQRDFQSYASFWFSQTLTQPFNSSSQIFIDFNSFFLVCFQIPIRSRPRPSTPLPSLPRLLLLIRPRGRRGTPVGNRGGPRAGRRPCRSASKPRRRRRKKRRRGRESGEGREREREQKKEGVERKRERKDRKRKKERERERTREREFFGPLGPFS